MSKQLKLRFQKLLKKADFVQADLEYHEELIGDAKTEFNQEIAQHISSLSKEQQQHIADINKEKQRHADEKLRQAAAAREQEFDEEIEEGALDENTALAESDAGPALDEDEEPTEDSKLGKLKKIFHRIASITHPDKASATGIGPREALRLEKLFKKARKAYKENNWYTLYSIALELELTIEDPGATELEWLENDIRRTMSSITQIGSTIAWTWYTGDDVIKHLALANYFEQAYGISIGPVVVNNNVITDLS